MKLSSAILIITLSLLIVAMFASNMLLKSEFDKIDKNDLYWNYDKTIKPSFKHLVLNGGNITNIAFEQSSESSVRVFKNWNDVEKKLIKTSISNDTLYITFPLHAADPGEREYLERITALRVFSPELLSVDGSNTHLNIYKLKEKNLSIKLSGKSKCMVESFERDFDNLSIQGKDSSDIIFAVSPDLKGSSSENLSQPGKNYKTPNHDVTAMDQLTNHTNIPSDNWKIFHVKSFDATIQNNSRLDMSYAQIDTMKLNIADSSNILVSGQVLKKISK